MTAEEFNVILEKRIEVIRASLVRKAEEYASDEDRLYNFKAMARMSKCRPMRAWLGVAVKPLNDLIDMVNSGKAYPAERWDEKLMDAINYLILLEGMTHEEPVRVDMTHEEPVSVDIRKTLMRTPRPWHNVFMSMAEELAKRSKDPSTQVGALIVDQRRRIISGGFNGPPHSCIDRNVPTDRPAKYDWFVHAELNAILFAHCDLLGCTMYVTGIPCIKCILAIAQSGIDEVFYGVNTPVMCNHEEQDRVIEIANACEIHLSCLDNSLARGHMDP